MVLYFQALVTPLRRHQETRVRSQKRGQHPLASYLSAQEYGLTARLLLTPLWWAFTSFSAYRALRKLLIPSQRSHWDKTPHGHTLATEAELERSRAMSYRGTTWDAATPTPGTFAARGVPPPSHPASWPLAAATEAHSGSRQLPRPGSTTGRQVLSRHPDSEPPGGTISAASPESEPFAELARLQALQTLEVTQPLRLRRARPDGQTLRC